MLVLLNLIFQRAKTDKNVIVDSRGFFSINKQLEWFQDPVVRNIMQYVDRTSVKEEFCLVNQLGMVIPPEYLSTGCKTAILV